MRYHLLVSMIALASMFALWYPASGNAQEVEEVVRKVKAVYQKQCCFKASFDQLTVNRAMDMKDRFVGTIYVKKPGLIALDVTSPEKQKVVLRGRSYTVYFAEDGNAVRGELPPDIDVEHFFGFFANIGSLDKYFVASFARKVVDPAENLLFLELIDRKNIRSTYRVVLGVDRESFVVKRAVISDALGNYNRFNLDRISFLDSLPDDTFRIQEGLDHSSGPLDVLPKPKTEGN